MPEKVMEKIKNSFSPQQKAGFFAALIMGLIAHLYKITNWLPNWDSLVFRYDSQNMISLGRWFLPVVCAPSSFYDLPFIAGLMAIVFHALGALCIVKMFDVKKKTTAVFVGAMIATFTTVTSVMMYNYVADGYAFAFLISCIAAMLLTEEKPCYIGSVVLIALSAGIYQADITVTIMLLLLHLILEIYNETKLKDILKKCGKFLLAGALGMALYYIILTVLLKITGTALLEYQGIDGAATLSGFDILGSLYAVKNSFTEYFFDFSGGIFGCLNVIVLVITVILYVQDAIKKKLGIGKFLMLSVFVILLPIGASVLCFVNSEIDYHKLMKMGFLVFYLFFILQYEKENFKSVKLNAVKLWTVFAITSVLIFNQVIIANVSYHKLNMAYEKSYGVLIRIADRIEQTEGTKDCDRLLVLGHLEGSEAYSASLPPDMTGTTDGYILRADDETVGQSVLCSAINDYCGKNYKFLAGEEKKTLLEKIDIEGYDIWPGKSSIFVVDNVIVINLGNEGE